MSIHNMKVKIKLLNPLRTQLPLPCKFKVDLWWIELVHLMTQWVSVNLHITCRITCPQPIKAKIISRTLINQVLVDLKYILNAMKAPKFNLATWALPGWHTKTKCQDHTLQVNYKTLTWHQTNKFTKGLPTSITTSESHLILHLQALSLKSELTSLTRRKKKKPRIILSLKQSFSKVTPSKIVCTLINASTFSGLNTVARK